MEWWKGMKEKHGERLFFMALALFFCAIFLLLSCVGLPVKEGPAGQLAGAAITILVGLAMLCFNKARGETEPKQPKPDSGQSGKGNTMAIMAVFLAFLFVACATNQPSRYDGGDYDDCLLYQIAQKHGTRIEDMGNLIRVAGLVGKAEGVIDPQDAIDVYTKIMTALKFDITGEAFVGEITFLSAEYQEILSIVLSYAPDFAVPYDLDDQTRLIMIDWCISRITYYQKLVDGAA